MDTHPTISRFWEQCRRAVEGLPSTVPDAWAFGATPAHADELLALVLDGVKTATASSLWDYEATGEPVPAVDSYSILLDGRTRPVAVIRTTTITIVPFGEVTARHAYREGEGDRTLEYWRESHERYWRAYSENARGFEPDMPVVCEGFRLMYAASSPLA